MHSLYASLYIVFYLMIPLWLLLLQSSVVKSLVFSCMLLMYFYVVKLSMKDQFILSTPTNDACRCGVCHSLAQSGCVPMATNDMLVFVWSSSCCIAFALAARFSLSSRIFLEDQMARWGGGNKPRVPRAFPFLLAYYSSESELLLQALGTVRYRIAASCKYSSSRGSCSYSNWQRCSRSSRRYLFPAGMIAKAPN